ncbi:hypothetical protein Kpol_1066p40 [Vanderwaltozyma polyspora DSM 70294]|uniref:Ras modification protein ERF4 n=1 Tax=Vanderwaltozyma polyspora (strain ATCC 22028 / DSM 70294 / BCRC 21397 / CBS 2163 / NBRC 10782 / NRRL Y-8283 / UCD 57-17) TaxID=436907 RepID=A7TMQ9_VANPO|nr:uncharacterized protein Kpol_1066p40 [Vanderwaltozyma polyspora DSM 70294]EDO16473.1 hypothetical protein Kpol_1066p40 [Vanderwaltozyma polyspora DSM 70294]
MNSKEDKAIAVILIGSQLIIGYCQRVKISLLGGANLLIIKLIGNSIESMNDNNISDGTNELSGDREPESVMIKPIFFNYHEFSEVYYSDISQFVEFKGHSEDETICITHFPNVYAELGSSESQNTRIVRIPRRFETTIEYPSFSNVLPGAEPAAMVNDDDGMEFVPHGIYDDDNQYFGYSSVSPLSIYLTQEQFEEIVETINKHCKELYSVTTAYNLIDFFLETVTLTLWRWVAKRVYPNPLYKIDDYVDHINNSDLFKDRCIKLIHPRDSGFLSLDFQIPKPHN